ncbi:MAG TPA: hypothetical protein VG759_25860 [Candidatus Angelobacter sp.]|jgi:hypothetical protein|nr:hypothetical protein [Candidatus Angelobacter sp.]
MKSQAPESHELVQYLLGKLPSERLESIEQRILLDDDFHQEAKIAEEDLLDDYVNGELTLEDRRLFETNFLTSSLRQQKLQFALALKKKCATAQPPVHFFPGWQRSPYLYACAALVIVVAVLASLNYRLARQLQQEHLQASVLTKELETARQHESAAAPGWGSQDALVVASLQPGGARSGGLQEISVPSGVRAAQFSLPAPADLRGEALVDLLNDNNQVITTLAGVYPQKIGDKEMLIVTFPREYLPRGNYFLRVRGRMSDSIPNKFSFKVGSR